MPAPAVIADLVERFEQQGDVYKSGQISVIGVSRGFQCNAPDAPKPFASGQPATDFYLLPV
jgi:hypothetical protein